MILTSGSLTVPELPSVGELDDSRCNGTVHRPTPTPLKRPKLPKSSHQNKRINKKSLSRDQRPYYSHLLEGSPQSSLSALKISRF
jgi:hypothetical protein